MNDQIQLIEIAENGNVEICVGADIVHTAGSFEAAAAWLTQAWGNHGREVVIPNSVTTNY
jgi:uncharacterized protein YbdZ (MbtH family)